MTGPVISYIAAAFSSIGLYIFTVFIRARLKTERLEILRKWVRTAVLSAEQIFSESKAGARKKAYVMAFLETKAGCFTHEEEDALIEAAVYCLNMETWSTDKNTGKVR